MFEILILLVVFGVGFFVGETTFAWRIRHIIYKEAKLQGISIDGDIEDPEDTKPNIAKLFIEKANDILYLYDYEANTFVCQAKTVDELASLAQKYKNIKYAVVAHDDDMLMFIDGLVKEKE
jgi:hypothetical protein